MPASERTQGTVRALWQVGARHGRPPAPTPEVDPWEVDDPLPEPDRPTVVAFDDPPITVRLFDDLQDTVAIEDTIEFGVPRHDTVAFVDAVLDGSCHLRRAAKGVVPRVLSFVFLSPFAAELVVTVGEGPGAREYVTAVPTLHIGSWLFGVPFRE